MIKTPHDDFLRWHSRPAQDGKMRESSILTPTETIRGLDLEGPKGMWIDGRKKIGDLGALGT